MFLTLFADRAQGLRGISRQRHDCLKSVARRLVRSASPSPHRSAQSAAHRQARGASARGERVARNILNMVCAPDFLPHGVGVLRLRRRDYTLAAASAPRVTVDFCTSEKSTISRGAFHLQSVQLAAEVAPSGSTPKAYTHGVWPRGEPSQRAWVSSTL